MMKGTITAPPSKSYSHRAVIAASLARGKSIIRNISECDDVKCTIDACCALGARIRKLNERLEITGASVTSKSPKRVYFGGSGTTLRLMLPLFSLCKRPVILDGDNSLRKRPNLELLKALDEIGIKTKSRNGKLPITVFPSAASGKRAHVTGKSSQFVSSLLFFSTIGNFEIVAKNISSRPYIDMTIDVMERAGVSVKSREGKFKTTGRFKKLDYTVPGDWSLASLFIAASCFIPSKLTIRGLKNDSQGDREILRILGKMGAKISAGDGIHIAGRQRLRGVSVSMLDYPDIVPAVAMAAAFANGKTKIGGVERLRDKESDRISGILRVLNAFGAKAVFMANKIVIDGDPNFVPKKIVLEKEHQNDHRLAMMAVFLGLLSKSRVLGMDCVKKSYPTFQRDVRCLKSAQ